MTLPFERTRAVLQARSFLTELSRDAAMPEAVRAEARRLLRHYPSEMDVLLAGKLEELQTSTTHLGAVFSSSAEADWHEQPAYVDPQLIREVERLLEAGVPPVSSRIEGDTIVFDLAALLDSEEAIGEYLSQVLADGDAAELIRAAEYLAKARVRR